MPASSQRSVATLGALLALLLGGCSAGGLSGGGLGVETSSPLTLPKFALPEAPPPGAAIGSTATVQSVGSATEVYSRVARGAVQCWFAAGGPMKQDYIYHAEADAPSRGGKAEITVHKRDPSQPNPRGAKVYRVRIEPAGDASVMQTENLKLPEPVAISMNADVGRWAKGEQGCAGATTAIGWTPPDPAAQSAKEPPAKEKSKQKAQLAKTKKPATTAAAPPQPAAQ